MKPYILLAVSAIAGMTGCMEPTSSATRPGATKKVYPHGRHRAAHKHHLPKK